MWLYLPSIPSPSAPESAGLTLGSVWQFRTLARSVTWRGKQLPPRAWLRRLKRDGFIRLLSGLTCEPLMLARGADAWISSLRATRAKETALPESGSASLTIAGCSIAPSKSLTPAGLVISSARTCRGTRTDSSPLPSRHWSDWAAALRAEYSARPKPATPCGASDCSSWPSPMAGAAGTENYNAAGNSDFSRKAMELADQVVERWAAPQARDHFPAHSPERIAAMKAQGHGMRNLNDEAEHWEGPSVAVTAGSRLTRSGDRADELLLTGQALETTAHFLPPSSPAQPIAAGSMSSTASPNTNQPSAKRKLNPIFVEALMRWPTGLSGFERQETAWTRWWLLMPSYLSALVSDCGPTEQMDLFGEAA